MSSDPYHSTNKRASRPGPAAKKGKFAAILIVLTALLTGLSIPSISYANGLDCMLFFPLPGRFKLGRETREIKKAEAPDVRADELINALLSGSNKGLAPAFPPGVTLRRVFVDQTGRALVDLNIDENTPARDATREALGLFALVNTLCYNLSEVNMVKFLVDGSESSTALGHVDISRSFLADESLVDDGSSR